MIEPMRWRDREFSFDLPVGWFPAVVERLRGTPPRAVALVEGLDDEILSLRPEPHWSVKDHIGHLADLAELDERRLDEFLGGATALSPADMQNRKTEDARHYDRPIADVLASLAEARKLLVDRLDTLLEADLGRSAIHPRLRRPMRLIDWLGFVADHDDHHLAHARAIVSAERP